MNKPERKMRIIVRDLHFGDCVTVEDAIKLLSSYPQDAFIEDETDYTYRSITIREYAQSEEDYLKDLAAWEAKSKMDKVAKAKARIERAKKTIEKARKELGN